MSWDLLSNLLSNNKTPNSGFTPISGASAQYLTPELQNLTSGSGVPLSTNFLNFNTPVSTITDKVKPPVTPSGAFGTGGWAMPAITAAGSAMGGWLGMKQYGLAKDAFKESKRQFNLNYNTQRNLTNTRLEDRQRARVASNAGAYQSVGDYMKENGV